jgi:hypothetical protein
VIYLLCSSPTKYVLRPQVSYNAPQLLKLGWAAPVLTLTRDNFPPATQLPVALPKLGTARKMALVIVPDWLAPPTSGYSKVWYHIVLSYRTRGGVDPELKSWFDGAANLHYITPTVYSTPWMMARVAPGEVHVDKDTGVVIRAPTAGDGSTLTISVCRYLVASSECGA